MPRIVIVILIYVPSSQTHASYDSMLHIYIAYIRVYAKNYDNGNNELLPLYIESKLILVFSKSGHARLGFK
jgi:hypothetical protein